jgi:SAM-dependent methyltransferase
MNVPHKCLKCGETLRYTEEWMVCSTCEAQWPVKGGIPSYDSAKYFGEISQKHMQNLVKAAENKHWLSVAQETFKESNPEMYQYIADINRACWIPLLPIGPESTVLDVGCGLGALTHALALNYDHVVSIEPIVERAAFTKVRVEQEGLKNVDVIQTTLDALPFFDKTFDLIVLNGILEWVGEWNQVGTPREVQLNVLKKLHRLLKPTGVLFVGIENRIGLDSFLGRQDHPGTRFTSLMPRWAASTYIRLSRPNFYRTLIGANKGYRTYTYSPNGYRKLLREAGFPEVDLWWPPAGYNLPYMILNSRNHQGVKGYCVHEQKYSDRVHGYSLKRLIKRWTVVNTNLIFHLFPDVLLFSKPTVVSRKEHCIAKQSLSGSILNNVSALFNDAYLGSLVTHPYKNKSVLTVLSEQGEIKAIVKVSNNALPGADISQIEYQRQQLIYSSLEQHGIRSSIPKPLGTVKVGRMVGTIEEVAAGKRLIELTVDRKYFKTRNRVHRHLDIITRWLINAARALETLEAPGVFETIPLEWCASENILNEFGQHRKLMQHGDFFPENIFLNEDKETISVIDWDNCGRGYPPLFDWFCLITGFYYTHKKVTRLPKFETIDFLSFQQTYFEPSWFAELVLASSKHLCQSLGFDVKHINTYFKAYLVLRRHQFISRVDLAERNYWAPLYGQYLEHYLHHESRTIFKRAEYGITK